MKNRCSLIISTYNWPAALNLCLQSVLHQSVLPDEVIIADDGSTEDTRTLIEGYQKHFPVPLLHQWHEDNGFRKTIILNKSLAQATGSYIIQVDGDVVLHKAFIADHLAFAKPGTFVAGTRMNTSPKLMQTIIKQGKLNLSAFTPGLKNFFNGIRLPILSPFLQNYKSSVKNIFYAKGCNMAFWKSSLIAINGYDEAFTGWGLEDSDLAVRLYNAGVKKRYLKMAGIVYHLWHQEFSRSDVAKNNQLLLETLNTKKSWAKRGIDQYLLH